MNKQFAIVNTVFCFVLSAVGGYVCSTIQCIICSSVGLLSFTHSINSPISHLSELTAKIIPCAISIDTPKFFNNSATVF